MTFAPPSRRRRAPLWVAVSLALVAVVVAAVPAVVGAVTGDARTRIVVIGASIAAGYRADPGPPWPQQVRDRFLAERSPLELIDASVSATRLLTTSEAGPSYLERVPAALDAETRAVVVTDLINDIQAVPHVYDPGTIVEGLVRLATVAHDAGAILVVTTIAPYGGYAFSAEQRFTAEGEACRQAVNAALRDGGIADQVIDLDRALADPEDLTRLNPALDSGDHLHPGAAGHRVIADTVDRGLVQLR